MNEDGRRGTALGVTKSARFESWRPAAAWRTPCGKVSSGNSYYGLIIGSRSCRMKGPTGCFSLSEVASDLQHKPRHNATKKYCSYTGVAIQSRERANKKIPVSVTVPIAMLYTNRQSTSVII
jgi:hypothetical protein